MCDLCESDCGNYDEVHGFCGHGLMREEIDELIVKIADEYRRGRRTNAIRLLTAHAQQAREEALREAAAIADGEKTGRAAESQWLSGYSAASMVIGNMVRNLMESE